MSEIKSAIGVAVIISGITLGGIWAIGKLLEPRLKAGDVITLFQDSTLITMTVLSVEDGKYQMQEGIYPDLLGAPWWETVSAIDRDPTIKKVGHVDIL